MGRKWLVLLTALLFSTVAIPAKPKMRTGTDTFKAACYWVNTLGYDVDCSEIERPIPVISRVVNAKGNKLYGFYYHNDKYVFVRVGLTPEREQAVILHETVHYILFEHYGRAVPRCESEQAARMVTDLYSSRPYSPAWKTWYDC